MPKLKQPGNLQGLAFDFLVRHTVRRCIAISNKGCLDGLRQSVAGIKWYLSEHLPSILFADFCEEFLEEYREIERYADIRPTSHERALLEIMMDVKMVGLICENPILCSLDPGDAHRIHGLKSLFFFPRKPYIPKKLENYHLRDITTLQYPAQCTDSELEIIGLQCPKLKILNVEASTQVTDKGLRALRPCSELRGIDLRDSGVSGDGVNELLDFHDKLEEFKVGNKMYGTPGPVFDVTQRHISMVHPSMKRFTLKCYGPPSEHLDCIVKLFPNLTHLEFRCKSVSDIADLCVLEDLVNLTSLDFLAGSFSMDNIRKLLISVGKNLTRLILRWEDADVTQNDLDFMFRFCPNLEWLDMCHVSSESTDELIIPSFKKLKYFSCWADFLYDDSHVELEFSEMLSLEIVNTQNIDGVFQIHKFLDSKKFPNLQEVRKVYHSEIDDFVKRTVEKFAKTSNLDFSLILIDRLPEDGEAIDWDDE